MALRSCWAQRAARAVQCVQRRAPRLCTWRRVVASAFTLPHSYVDNACSCRACLLLCTLVGCRCTLLRVVQMFKLRAATCYSSVRAVSELCRKIGTMRAHHKGVCMRASSGAQWDGARRSLHRSAHAQAHVQGMMHSVLCVWCGRYEFRAHTHGSWPLPQPAAARSNKQGAQMTMSWIPWPCVAYR